MEDKRSLFLETFCRWPLGLESLPPGNPNITGETETQMPSTGANCTKAKRRLKHFAKFNPILFFHFQNKRIIFGFRLVLPIIRKERRDKIKQLSY